jgi:aryl-alcohol dehydrogenase-like predicted oxidoreductase
MTAQNRIVGTFPANPIGLGCMSLSFGYGPASSSQHIKAIIELAIDLGVNFFDTAAVYGDGHNETELGRSIAPYRSQVAICTKGGMTAVYNAQGRQRKIDSRPEVIRSNCEDSLRRLGVEVIDLYYLHRWDKVTPIEEVAGAMADLIAAGKIRGYGLSEVSASTLRQAHKTHPVTAIQSEYSLWTRNPEIAVLPTCEELGITLVAFSPVARGFLSLGSPEPLHFEEKDLRRVMPRFQSPYYEKNLLLRKQLKDLAEAAGLTNAQLLLAWVLEQSPSIVTIPGTTRLDHLRENMKTQSLNIAAEVLKEASVLINQNTVAGERYDSVATGQVGTERFEAK